jgi:hypothetical protein
VGLDELEDGATPTPTLLKELLDRSMSSLDSRDSLGDLRV